MEGTYDRRDGELPLHIVYLRAIQNPETVQWNPFIFCGNTLLSDGGYSFFYPINWLLWSFPESSLPASTTVILIVNLFFVGYFMRLLLKKIVKDEFWATCGTIAYVLSWSSMQMLVGYPDKYVMFVYVPLNLYLIYTFNKRDVLSNFILQTIANSLLLLGGSVQFNLYAFGFTICFALFKGLRKNEIDGTRSPKLFAVSGGSVLLAIMISAVRYVPFYLATRTNAALRLNSEDLAGLPLRTLMNIVLPGFFPGEIFLCYSGIFAFLKKRICNFFPLESTYHLLESDGYSDNANCTGNPTCLSSLFSDWEEQSCLRQIGLVTTDMFCSPLWTCWKVGC